MVSAGETDANLRALKSQACESAWEPVLSRLSMESNQNEVKQHPSGMAQATGRHLLLLSGSRHWACSRWARTWLKIILFPGQYPKLHMLALLRWDLSLAQKCLQRVVKEKWSKTQVFMKFLGCLLLVLCPLKEKCCTEPCHTSVVMAFGLLLCVTLGGNWGKWIGLQSLCTKSQLQGKTLRDPHHEKGLTLLY